MDKGQEYLRVVFEVADANQGEVLMALLTEAGFEGFQESRSLVEAFAPVPGVDRQLLDQIAQKLGLPYKAEVMPQVNWNAEWESSFQPVTVEDYCTIRAAFHPPAGTAKYELIITPKMSFGTGHHATTYLMVKAMKELDFKGKRVLDFGTGTGVLAILAEKAGAASVDALDCDEWSIENAWENIRSNACKRITVRKTDHVEVTGNYSIILANVNKNVILSQMDRLAGNLIPGGVLLISGVLNNDRDSVLEFIEKHKLQVINTLVREEWLMVEVKL